VVRHRQAEGFVEKTEYGDAVEKEAAPEPEGLSDISLLCRSDNEALADRWFEESAD
jgi:hypothetical protein